MKGPSHSELDIADAREKPTDIIEELIVGRTEEKRKIMDILVKVMSEKIVILPIYGIGGIGKTTFARLIYNDPKFKHYSLVWVDVTQRFDLNKIRGSIISQLSGKERQICLSGKKILVVLDDLWEDDQLHLQGLKDMLYNDDSNIIVLVTTHSERVAERICTNLQPYKMLPLTNDMC
jgi:Cdc6-like AAA superfamily ATPase